MVNESSAADPSMDQLAGRVFALARALRSAGQRRAVPSHGLRPGDLGVLRVLEQFGAQRPGAIAEHLAVGPSVVSRQLAPLANDGLISRRADPADGRAEIIEITTAGHQRVAVLMREYSGLFSEHFAHWESERVDAAIHLLNELIEAINGASSPVGASAAPSERPAS